MPSFFDILIFGLLILLLLVVVCVYLIFFNIFLKVEAGTNWLLEKARKLIKKLFRWFLRRVQKWRSKKPNPTQTEEAVVSQPEEPSAVSVKYGLWDTKTVLMFGTCFLSVGYILLSFLTAADIHDCYVSIFNNTCLGGLADLLLNGLDVQGHTGYSAMFATAFGSFLSYVYMKFTVNNLDDFIKNKILHWIVFVLLNVIFLAASSLLSEQLHWFFGTAADWIFDLYTRLSAKIANADVQTFVDALPLIGSVLLVAPIFCAGALTLFITFREYLASIMYGIASVLLIIIVSLVFEVLLQDRIQFPQFIAGPFAFVSMFAIDFVRVHDGAHKKFCDFIDDLAIDSVGFLLTFIGK